jgi:hypothetical protein
MRIFLFIVSVFAVAMGALIFSGARSAIHEIEGFVLFLIAAVLFSAAAIIDAIHKQKP